MQRGPRLYNALSDEERLARLRRKAARKEKEVHRVRKNRIIACFAIAILIFGLQLIMVHVQTGRINSQIQTNKAELNQVNKTNKKLTPLRHRNDPPVPSAAAISQNDRAEKSRRGVSRLLF